MWLTMSLCNTLIRLRGRRSSPESSSEELSESDESESLDALRDDLRVDPGRLLADLGGWGVDVVAVESFFDGRPLGSKVHGSSREP